MTSRTIGFISQSTVTQREVDSDPNVADHNSTLYGPGYVAAIRLGGHFPPGVPFTPQVDLMGIEHTNRDTSVKNGVTLPSRFNVPQEFVPLPANEQLAAPDSYGYLSGIFPSGQPRGIGTLPGGIPIYNSGGLVGGIGVFFPGQTGYSSEENSSLSTNYDSSKPDRSLEAEYVAYAALGGVPGNAVGDLGGVALPAGLSLVPQDPGIPVTTLLAGINLVGVSLDIFGPGGTQGPKNLVEFGQTLGQGDPNSGTNVKIDRAGNTLQDGTVVPAGWLVTPHDGVGISAADVEKVIYQGIAQANQTRAAIRLPAGSRTRMVFAVTDSTGAVLGIYRMPDATIFSIDVAVAKARNVAYYDDPAQLMPADQVPGVPAGTSFTNRTFRYLAQARFPEGIDGSPPGPFSILNDPGINPYNALNLGSPEPASVYQSVYGYDSFHPGTNFRAQTSPLNQNGIIFFPGSSAVYKDNGASIVGGYGVSGDGVDQDDVVTAVGITGFEPAPQLRVDMYTFRGVRLPYMKFNRNPEGGSPTLEEEL